MPIPPRLPDWALWAGVPEPHEGEGFCEYVSRLGLDPEPMLIGLDERTYCLANQRLASELMRQSPDLFMEYVSLRRAAYA